MIGYLSSDRRTFVRKEDARDYMLQECGIAIVDDDSPEHEEFMKDFLWWFYQNWEEVEE